MTMHVVLGDGEMTRRELTASLSDLWKADVAQDQSFWFLLQGKSEPTDTDTALVTWIEKNDIYYEVVTDDPESMNALYSQPQEVHTAKKLKEKVVGLLQSKPEEGEPAEMLALFFDVNDPTAAEDKWLNQILQAVYDAGFPCRAFNDGMAEIDMSAEAAEAEPEAVEETPAPAKVPAVAKKVAPPVDTEVPAEDATASPPPAPAATVSGRDNPPTRAQLEEMEPTEVKAIAAEMGIVLAPRTRATTYINHILGEVEAETTPAAEVTPVPEVAVDGYYDPGSNGHLDPEELADMVAERIWSRIAQAFSASV